MPPGADPQRWEFNCPSENMALASLGTDISSPGSVSHTVPRADGIHMGSGCRWAPCPGCSSGKRLRKTQFSNSSTSPLSCLSKAKRKLDLEGIGRPAVPEFRTPKGKCIRVDGLPSPKSKSFWWAPASGWHGTGGNGSTQVTSTGVCFRLFPFPRFLVYSSHLILSSK